MKKIHKILIAVTVIILIIIVGYCFISMRIQANYIEEYNAKKEALEQNLEVAWNLTMPENCTLVDVESHEEYLYDHYPPQMYIHMLLYSTTPYEELKQKVADTIIYPFPTYAGGRLVPAKKYTETYGIEFKNLPSNPNWDNYYVLYYFSM